MENRKKMIAVVAVLAGVTGCSSGSSLSANQQESRNQAEIQGILDKNQHPPMKSHSEKRQLFIDLTNAQMDGVATTTFFVNPFSQDPIFACPSIGYPIPGSSQLTNPTQVVINGVGGTNGGNMASVIHQMDPDGTYTGPTNGMYVECVSPSGKSYIVHDGMGRPITIGGPAHWDTGLHAAVLDGEPTVLTPGKVR